MHRSFVRLLAFSVLVWAAGCRTYDGYDTIASQGGLVPADQFATYGREQAQAVAIGRELAMARGDGSPEARAGAVAAASDFAHRLPDVSRVRADTLGHRLVVTFRSGWVRAIVPIGDGKNGAETPNLPNLKPPASPRG